MVNSCENGGLVPVNDVASLAIVIEELPSDQALQKKPGISARHAVQTRFTLQNELDGNVVLYRNLGLKI